MGIVWLTLTPPPTPEPTPTSGQYFPFILTSSSARYKSYVICLHLSVFCRIRSWHAFFVLGWLGFFGIIDPLAHGWPGLWTLSRFYLGKVYPPSPNGHCPNRCSGNSPYVACTDLWCKHSMLWHCGRQLIEEILTKVPAEIVLIIDKSKFCSMQS